MGKCPVCQRDDSRHSEICECGYHFERKEIRDWRLAGKYFAELSKAKDWVDEVRFLNAITNVQKRKLSRWSQRATAKNLNLSKGTVSIAIQLAEALDKFPQICEYQNKMAAFVRLQEIKQGGRNLGTENDDSGSPFCGEQELRDFLVQNWDRTSLAGDWELKSPDYHTSVGNIDLLARHKTEKKWLVIELKVSKTSDDAVGQLLRYMGWAKLNLAGIRAEKVEGLIIARSMDENTFCSLVDSQGIKVNIYKLKDNTLYLQGLDDSSLLSVIVKILNPSETREVFKNLKEQNPDSRAMRIINVIQACS